MTIPIVGEPFTVISTYLTTNIVCRCQEGRMQFLVIFGTGQFTPCPQCKRMYGVQLDPNGQPTVVVAVSIQGGMS